MKKNMNSTTSIANEAVLLMNYAQLLSKASTSKNEKEIIGALDANLKLWVEIETILKKKNANLSSGIKDNLLSLSKFVERLTLTKGLTMTK
ncbi:MAG: hypothetical protein LBL47_02585, partial [Lactobacillus sp.]|nr:hypothetical protein [Lactobacillus sp.]